MDVLLKEAEILHDRDNLDGRYRTRRFPRLYPLREHAASQGLEKRKPRSTSFDFAQGRLR
jgi:hypothetical protein